MHGKKKKSKMMARGGATKKTKYMAKGGMKKPSTWLEVEQLNVSNVLSHK